MRTQIHIVYTVYTTLHTVVGRRGGTVYGVCHIIFLVFSNFHFQKGVQVIIGLKLKVRIMSSVAKKQKTKKKYLQRVFSDI